MSGESVFTIDGCSRYVYIIEKRTKGRQAMQNTEIHVLEAATAALHRTTGLTAEVLPQPVPTYARGADALLEIRGHRRRYRFVAEVKTVDRFATPALVKTQLAGLKAPPILVAPYVTRETAQLCRALHLAFMDTAGNAYLEGPGFLVWVIGETRPADLKRPKFRALTPAGLRTAFALLCKPNLIQTNYREIAWAANVALGTVGPAVKDLEARGLLRVTGGGRQCLLEPKRLLEEWVAHYHTTLRPKLNPRRFDADMDVLAEKELQQYGAFWGGEVAADRLTHMLKPAACTIYAREPIAKLVAGLRLRALPEGRVEVLKAFWNLPPEPEHPDTAPAPLVYADLLATQDGRNVEVAQILYERIIEPQFHTTR